MYDTDPTVNDIVLTVINDGQGDQCGWSYAQRCDVAKMGNAYALDLAMRSAARRYGQVYRVRQYGSKRATAAQAHKAGAILSRYYAEHAKELV